MTKQEFVDRVTLRAPYLADCAPFAYDGAVAYNLSPFLLVAIADRESRGGRALDANGCGDGGHGHGIWQFDDRYWADFCKDGAHDPAKAAEKAAWLIRKYTNLLGSEQHGVAAYNCGPGGVRRALAEGTHADTNTTGGDYSRWVYRRMRQLES